MEATSNNKAPGSWERRIVGAFVRNALGWRPPQRTFPIRTQLPWQPIRFAGNSGADLSGRWFPAPGARGTAVLVHPDRRSAQQWFLTHGWVEFLLDHRFHVLTFDLAGFGESRGGSTYLLEDVAAACRAARDRSPGLPIHLVGVSLGAFSAINAAPHLDFLESLVLESPFPNFNAWYGRGWGRAAMAAFDRIFPRTAALIQADRNIAKAQARRILVVGSRRDEVTPIDLTRAVAAAAPPERTDYLELDDASHLELFDRSASYRDAMLRTLEGPTPTLPPPIRRGRALEVPIEA